MKILIKILYLISYVYFPKLIIEDLILFEQIESLKLIAKKGHYKNRLQIANNLNLLKKKHQSILIEILIDDKVESISQSIIEDFQMVKFQVDLNLKIENKKKFWKQNQSIKNKKLKLFSKIYKGTKNYKRKFSKGESYQNAKEMLKKPMNTGKWF